MQRVEIDHRMHLPALPVHLGRLFAADGARWATVVLTIAIAYSLVGVTWRFWPTPQLVSPPTAAQGSKAGEIAGANRGPTLKSVADLHLFGQAAAPQARVEPALADAPETRLNLTLRGVFAAGEPALALAIIADGKGEERSYRVGAELPGGATLREVLADRVVLERNQRFETLRLPKETTGGTASFDRDPAVSDTSPPGGELARQIAGYREKILANPQEAAKLVQVQPVMEDGKIKGYRVNPRAERQLFRQAGLQPGDVVTSVNGLPLDDPTKLGEVISNLSTAQQVTLAVDRDGRQETVVIPVQP